MHLYVYCECVDDQVGFLPQSLLGRNLCDNILVIHVIPTLADELNCEIAQKSLWEYENYFAESYGIPHECNLKGIILICIYFMLFAVFHLNK